MMDEYDKCNFCASYDSYDGCINWFCTERDSFKPDKQKIIEKAKKECLSVADVIALIVLGVE